MASYMSTVISRKPADIIAHISRLRSSLSSNPLLYTISVSQSTESSDLAKLVDSVKSLSNNSVGCLSAPIPSAHPSWQRYSAVSLASFDQKNATLFRSTIPGRKAAQVGRWHALHKSGAPEPEAPSTSEGMDWDFALSNAYDGSALPAALQNLSAEKIDSILYFSDNAPEGLSSTLSHFAPATKLGLIGSSTPFITGRPYTLFHNDSIHSSGAVGVCLSSPIRPYTQSAFPGLEAITRPMIVTSSEGNLVNALDNANPSRLLLHAIQSHPSLGPLAEQGISSELKLYMGTLKQKGGTHELDQLYYVMSGDPSRGSLALDTDAAPAEGALVQVFLLLPSAAVDAIGEVQKQRDANGARRTRSLTFVSTSIEEMEGSPASLPGQDSETRVLEDVFLAASENGCIVSRSEDGRSERPWKCGVPGGMVGLQWTT
ncbi:hypothetical protein BV20DRAFT_18529 [Pilatotrama ljubarskyi]|nr:hypothetical protein BV20DRAFT_18529 [Pilatotrama ljubarskyi]